MLEVYHRAQTNGCAAELAYRQHFLCTTQDNLAGPIPAPHVTYFVDRSDEMLISKYSRSATRAETPIQILSIYLACISAFGVVRWWLTLSFPWAHKISEDSTCTVAREVSSADCAFCCRYQRESGGARCAAQLSKFHAIERKQKNDLCQSEPERIPPHPKHTHIKKQVFIYVNSLYGPASWIHTKGDTSEMPSTQRTEHPRTSPPGSNGSEHMPLYPSCVRLLESSASRAMATCALEAWEKPVGVALAGSKIRLTS